MAASGITWRRPRPIAGARAYAFPRLSCRPIAKRGFVDHTQYDTTSILRFITERFGLPVLPGIDARNAALKAHGAKPMGDLTNALDLRRP